MRREQRVRPTRAAIEQFAFNPTASKEDPSLHANHHPAKRTNARRGPPPYTHPALLSRAPRFAVRLRRRGRALRPSPTLAPHLLSRGERQVPVLDHVQDLSLHGDSKQHQPAHHGNRISILSDAAHPGHGRRLGRRRHARDTRSSPTSFFVHSPSAPPTSKMTPITPPTEMLTSTSPGSARRQGCQTPRRMWLLSQKRSHASCDTCSNRGWDRGMRRLSRAQLPAP